MPTLFCCILNCETESVSSKKRKIFYRLPQNAERKQLWLNQIGDRIKYGTISPNSRICNAHFATGKPNLDSSHIDYIPSIFPWSSKEDMSKSHQAVENYEMKIKELEQKILAKAFLTASTETKTSPESEVSKLELEDYSKLNTEVEIKNKFQKINTQSESSVNQIQTISHPIVSMANKSSSIDVGNTVTLNSNLINYLINSLTHVNVSNNTNTVSTMPLSVNIAMPTCPLNLSQSYNKIEEESVNEVNKSMSSSLQMDNKMNPEFFKPINQNGQMFSFQIQNVINVTQTPLQLTPTITTAAPDETNNRSCTCTKSSCLKLYCECFATGNVCSQGCTCINCRNNHRYKEERDKIVCSYLERDPWVFNSKIDTQEVGKKHTKGCNCLKSSCLKNYCECFENKVFCSSLCRCRLCCNNEDHSYQNNRKDDVKIYPASATSDSLSVLSDNSPRDSGRKRKPSVLKSNEMYEDVSSNESSEEHSIKRQQMDPDLTVLPVLGDGDRQGTSGRTILSMDIPPVLPQEDDFTEEELAMMLRFREQRSVKAESVTPPLQQPPPPQHTPINFTNGTHYQAHSMTTPPVLSIPTQIDSALLLSLSKSLAVANLGVSLVNSGGPTNIGNPCLQALHQPSQDITKTLTSNDFLNLLVSQQLMVPRMPSASTSYSHVVPINLTQQAPPQTLVPPQVTGPPISSSRPQYSSVQAYTTPQSSMSSSPTSVATMASLPFTMETMPQSMAPMPQSMAQMPQSMAQMPQSMAPMPQSMAPMPQSMAPMPQSMAQMPTNMVQMPQHAPMSLTLATPLPPATVPMPPQVTSAAHIPSTNNCSLPVNMNNIVCPPKNKLSTEDYVRRHIEAAERAVRADNMRRDCLGTKKAIIKQKVKIEPNVSPTKTSRSFTSSGEECTGSLVNGHTSPISRSPPLSSSSFCQHWSNHGGHSLSSCVGGTHACGLPSTPSPTKDHSSSDTKWKHRYKTLRSSLQHMRTELRSIKVHMRADQSKIRRLEAALLQMSNELHK